MPNSTVLIVGATRGLGASLVQHYLSQPSTTVLATCRAFTPPDSPKADKLTWIPVIDLTQPTCGSYLATMLPTSAKIDTVILTAGYFGLESFDKPDWEAEMRMYTTSSIAPVFVVQALVKAEKLASNAKVILVSSESGSLTLRHESEGGGNYGHHASKAALNMVGKLLSFDLKDKNIAVGMVHPGFMRTEMTKGVGFDKFWDVGGAVTPDVAAKSLAEWVEGFGMEKTGEYWAPRGPGDIGTVEETVGKKSELPTPMRLPW